MSLINFKYLLSDLKNYNSVIDTDQYNINNKYSLLVIDYLKNVFDTGIQKNKQFDKFIILRGLNTITHVYTMLIYYTKNIDLSYYHAQKSFYFYIEFIEQITTDKNTFLNLSSKDACMFVYKKTIFEINNEIKKTTTVMTPECCKKITSLNNHIYFFKIIIYNDINITTRIVNETITRLQNINKILFETVFDNIFNNIDIIKMFSELFECNNISRYYEIVYLFIKKINKTENILDNDTNINILKIKIKNKITDNQFQIKLDNSLIPSQKIVNWLVM